MTAEYFVELVSRNGEVQTRQPIIELPVRIGRAYDNDIILNDPHTAAHHARIDKGENGQLIISELPTYNGIVLKGKRVKTVALDGNTIVRLGHTNLRVRERNFVVAEEIADSTNHHWEGWLPGLVGLLLITLQAMFSHWLNQTSKIEALEYLTQIVTMFSGIAIWSGAWALINHLFSGQTRFGRHLFIASCGIFLSEVCSLLISYLAYAFSLEFFTRYAEHASILIVASAIFFHLLTVIPRHKQRLVIITALLALCGSGLTLITNYQNSGNLTEEVYMGILLPPATRQSQDASVAEFIDQAASMKILLEESRLEEVETKADDEQDAIDAEQ